MPDKVATRDPKVCFTLGVTVPNLAKIEEICQKYHVNRSQAVSILVKYGYTALLQK